MTTASFRKLRADPEAVSMLLVLFGYPLKPLRHKRSPAKRFTQPWE